MLLLIVGKGQHAGYKLLVEDFLRCYVSGRWRLVQASISPVSGALPCGN
jgi:hypothetical protein